MTNNTEFEKQIMKGVKAFQEVFGDQLKDLGFEIPKEWILEDHLLEPENPIEDTEPAIEAVRLLRLAEKAVLKGDPDTAAGLLAVVDRYIRIDESL